MTIPLMHEPWTTKRRCGKFEYGAVGTPYARYFRDLRLLRAYINGRPEDFPKNANLKIAVNELISLANLLSRKPNLCLLGEFDAGKSTLANTLMGTEQLPAKIAPHTALPTVVRHVNDRPEWMQEQIYFFGTFLSPAEWDDKSVIDKHLIDKGPIEILHQATHKRTRFSSNSKNISKHLANAQMALAFIDSPLLNTCNIIDFPGYGHDDHDEEKAQHFEALADIVIYLSPINGFLKSQEIYRIGQILSKIGDLEVIENNLIPPLGNFFIVASHADPGRFDSDDITAVFESAGMRIQRQLGEFAISEKSRRIKKEINKNHITDRLFLFWRESGESCITFDQTLFSLLTGQLPKIWRSRAEMEIKKLRNHKIKAIGEMIELYEARLADLKEMEKVYKKYRSEEPARQHKMKQKVAAIVAQIKQFSTQSCEEFQDDFESLVVPDNLERLIREKFEGKKDAQEYAFGYVHEVVNRNLKDILTPKTERISAATEVFVQQYRDPQVLDEVRVDVGFTADDMGAFLAGATATGTLGALASLGLVYGGSWLAANTTGALAAIGAGAAGVGAAVATGLGYALSFLTGPIGIAIVSGLALFAVFRAPWQERLAKEIAKKMHDDDALRKFKSAIRQYWADTERAFLGGVSELDKRWAQGLEELRNQVADPEKGQRELASILKEMTQARNFFLGLTWNDQ